MHQLSKLRLSSRLSVIAQHLFHVFNRQSRVKDIPLLHNACNTHGMIDPSVCLQGEAEQGQVIFVFRNVGAQKLNLLAIILRGDLLARR